MWLLRAGRLNVGLRQKLPPELLPGQRHWKTGIAPEADCPVQVSRTGEADVEADLEPFRHPPTFLAFKYRNGSLITVVHSLVQALCME